MKPLFICVVSLFVLAPVQYEFGHADQIILVVLDGADPSVFSLKGFPLYGECEAVFPPMTSPGHVSLLTGVYPNRHGILANEYIDDKKTKNYIPPMIEVVTVFDILKENGKKGIFISGKKGLAAFMGGRANLTVSPVVYPVYLSTPPEDPYELTRWIFDAITEIDEREHPDFLCVNVPILDELGHAYGPESKETEEAVKVVQDLVYSLRDSLDGETTLIVTADHGMSSVSKAVPIHVLLRNEQYETWPLHVGRSAYLYDVEEGVKEFVLNQRGVKGVIEPKDYPQYHIDHKNAPDLIVLAQKDYLFIPEPLLESFKGMHGSPDERDVFVYMAGKGIPEGYTECYQVDITPLACYMLDISTDATFDGSIPVIKEKKPEEAGGVALLVLAGILWYLMISRRS